jgi:hypothetical protein
MAGFVAATRHARRMVQRGRKRILVFRGGAPVAPGDAVMGRRVAAVRDYASLELLLRAEPWRLVAPAHATRTAAEAYLVTALGLRAGDPVRAAELAEEAPAAEN